MIKYNIIHTILACQIFAAMLAPVFDDVSDVVAACDDDTSLEDVVATSDGDGGATPGAEWWTRGTKVTSGFCDA